MLFPEPPLEIVAALHFVLAICTAFSVKVEPIRELCPSATPPASRSKRVRPAENTRALSLPTYFTGSDILCEEPDEYLTIEKCKALKKSGLGDFVKRGKAFLRRDKDATQRDRKIYNPSGRRGDSLRIDEAPPMMHAHGIMTRYVDGDKAAIVAVNGWMQLTHCLDKRKHRPEVKA